MFLEVKLSITNLYCCVVQLVIAVILNVVSAALAITAAVLYSVDMATGNGLYCTNNYYGYAVTPSPEQMRNTEICVQYKYLNQVMFMFYLLDCVGSNDQSWGGYFSLWFHKQLVIQSYCMNLIFCKST